MMTEDWGVLAELQLKDLQTKNLSFASNQTGLNLFGVRENFIEFSTKNSSNDNVDAKNKKPVPTVKKKPTFKAKKSLSDYVSARVDSEEEEEPDLSAAEQYLLKKILRTHLLETTADVEVQRRKHNSPLYSVKSFEQLFIPPNLLRGIYAMGFNTPTRIQETSLPTLLANPPVNMIAQAQSGTGKTAAFLLASLARISAEQKYPQVLILSPTYELTIQLGEVAKKMAEFCPDISCRYAIKGERIAKGEPIDEHMVVGTPGKVFDWARRYVSFDMKKIKVFVLDEADVMISTQGHQDQCIRIHKMLPRDCQMLLFSATYTQEVMEFAEQIIPNPIIIRVRKEEETLDNVKQRYIKCASPDVKYDALMNIYGAISVGQTIIFCRTKSTAFWLGQKLTEDGHSVGYLSSDLSVTERFSVISRFRDGIEKVLITTNVCARGIDIQQVTMVVNFDLPVLMNGRADCETYLHRIGRTGRFGKNGIALNFVSGEKDELILKEIEEHFSRPISLLNSQNADELERLNQ